MKPLFHSELVNSPFEDSALHIEMMFGRRGLLFDIGDIRNLSNREILRISDVFVSHTHMDHFAGLDHLVRISLGRQQRVRLFGPTGFIDRVENKLHGYTWNLIHGYPTDFALVVTEVDEAGRAARAEFHSRLTFRREQQSEFVVNDATLHEEAGFSVRYTALDHRIPSLAFALREKLHINVWKNRLTEMGLAVGPWLNELKRLVREGAPPETPVHAGGGREFALGELKQRILQTVPGQKLAYVTDAAGHEENARRIIELVRGADILYIETAFVDEDRAIADKKYHLTARRAGEIARRAGVRRLVPFHFSARYTGMADRLRREAEAAHEGRL